MTITRAMTTACALLSLGACSSGSKATNSDAAGNNDTAAGDTSTGGLGFAPSNVDLTGLDLSKVDDLTVTGSNNFINGETGAFVFAQTTQFVYKTFTRADSTRLAMFVVKSLRLESGGSLALDGALPVAIVALNTIDIVGSFDVPLGRAGGMVQAAADMKGAGPGGGPGGSETPPLFAGSGGSFCGIGGAGSTASGGAANTKSTAYGMPTLVPLVGGSSGGTGAVGNNGAGGGALQLTAGTSVTVAQSGYISAPGGGGSYGGLGTQEAGGGGSGGAILIEAPTVTIAGVLAANGGGGGQGNGDAGQNGKASADPAVGGRGAFSGASSGGNGGAGATADGTDGMFTTGNPAGGGGGGVGRIRLNTRTGQAVVTGTLSPAATTACVTQGMI